MSMNEPKDPEAAVDLAATGSEFLGMSESDIDMWRLTGVKPAPSEQRQCVMCKQMGHYYYECNNGEFFRSLGDFFGIHL